MIPLIRLVGGTRSVTVGGKRPLRETPSQEATRDSAERLAIRIFGTRQQKADVHGAPLATLSHLVECNIAFYTQGEYLCGCAA
jgi:hypothetical protein